MIRSIVKDSEALHNALLSRWEELDLTQQEVADMARKALNDVGFTRQAINSYIKDPYRRGALNEEQILALAKLFSIDVTLVIKVKKHEK